MTLDLNGEWLSGDSPGSLLQEEKMRDLGWGLGEEEVMQEGPTELGNWLVYNCACVRRRCSIDVEG